jgi:hypothetical protein
LNSWVQSRAENVGRQRFFGYFFLFFFEKSLDNAPTFMVRLPPTPQTKVLAIFVPTRSWHGSCFGGCISTACLTVLYVYLETLPSI